MKTKEFLLGVLGDLQEEIAEAMEADEACPHCIAKNYLDNNSTRLLFEMNKISGGDHEELAYDIYASLISASVTEAVFSELIHMHVGLLEAEEEESNDRID